MATKSDIDMSKYTRVEAEKETKEEKKGELLVRKTSATRGVISQAIHLLTKEDCRSIVFKARGQAVSKAVGISEIVKRRVPGLHQILKLDCGELTQTYKLKEGETGEPEITKTKFVTGIELCLSLDELDKTHIGYQEPLSQDQVHAEEEENESKPSKPRSGAKGKASGGRGAGKGGRGKGGRGGAAPAGRGAAPAGRGSAAGRGGAKGGKPSSASRGRGGGRGAAR